MNPGFDPYHGISAIGWAARQEKPDCLLIGEFWQLDGTHPTKSAAKLVQETPLDAYWNGDFHHILDDMLNQRWEWEKRDIFRAIGGFRSQGLTMATGIVNYSCSHDEVRPEHEIIFYSQGHITRPAQMTVQQMAQTKAFLGLVTLLTAPGIPMLYAGQEFAEDAPRTIDFQPLHWDKLQQVEHQQYLRLVKQLIATRRAHPALAGDHIRFYPTDFPREQVVRFDRFLTDETNGTMTDFVAVALNFSGVRREVELTVPWSGRWHDVISEKFHTINQTIELTLPPWQAAVLLYTR
jgi:1,4-alpha-glucan branching enzyme